MSILPADPKLDAPASPLSGLRVDHFLSGDWITFRAARPSWPHLVGRGKYGEFPLVVVREHYRKQGGRERFFVEVKWKDHITKKQRVTFPLIERHCGVRVRIARIAERGLR